MQITFIRRSEPKTGEVTLSIHQDAGMVLGEVSGPGLEGSGTAAEKDRDGQLGVQQALASAITLAEEHGQTVGVIDHEDHWREEWGDLVEETV